jgi:hypothetical protein
VPFACDERFFDLAIHRILQAGGPAGHAGFARYNDRDVDRKDGRSDLLHVICGGDGDIPRSKEARNRKSDICREAEQIGAQQMSARKS